MTKGVTERPTSPRVTPAVQYTESLMPRPPHHEAHLTPAREQHGGFRLGFPALGTGQVAQERGPRGQGRRPPLSPAESGSDDACSTVLGCGHAAQWPGVIKQGDFGCERTGSDGALLDTPGSDGAGAWDGWAVLEAHCCWCRVSQNCNSRALWKGCIG